VSHPAIGVAFLFIHQEINNAAGIAAAIVILRFFYLQLQLMFPRFKFSAEQYIPGQMQ
jgi:hypothetical protein